jgi:AcrR family transcriptional regulator
MTNKPPPAGDLRANQKQRTRAAVVDAATQLLRHGPQPTVAQAAELAKVSRATAYRYFPTVEALMVEVAQVNPAAAPIEQWLAGLDNPDAGERLRGLIEVFNEVARREEAALRTGLRVYLDTWIDSRRRGDQPLPLREGRRTRWLEQVLEPARKQLRPAVWRRLHSALALTLGIEALVVLKDVCKLSDDEALATQTWAAQALLRASLDAGATKPAARKKPARSPA